MNTCRQTNTKIKITDLHGDGNGGNPVESAGNPREWIELLREYREDGICSCGKSTFTPIFMLLFLILFHEYMGPFSV